MASSSVGSALGERSDLRLPPRLPAQINGLFDSVITDLHEWTWSVFKDDVRVLGRSPVMKAAAHLECSRMKGNSFSVRKSLLDTWFVKHQSGLIGRQHSAKLRLVSWRNERCCVKTWSAVALASWPRGLKSLTRLESLSYIQ